MFKSQHLLIPCLFFPPHLPCERTRELQARVHFATIAKRKKSLEDFRRRSSGATLPPGTRRQAYQLESFLAVKAIYQNDVTPAVTLVCAAPH